MRLEHLLSREGEFVWNILPVFLILDDFVIVLLTDVSCRRDDSPVAQLVRALH